MLREHLDSLRRLLFVAYISLVVFCYHTALYIESQIQSNPFNYDRFDEFLPIILIIWGFVLYNARDCYSFRSKSIFQVARTAIRASLFASSVYVLYIFFIGYSQYSKLQTATFLILSMFSILAMRLSIHMLLEYIRSRGFNYQTVIVVGRGRRAKAFADRIFTNQQWGYKITGFLFSGVNNPSALWSYRDVPAIGNLSNLPEIIKSQQVDWIVFAVENAELSKIEQAVKVCDEMGTRAAVLTDLYPSRYADKRIEEFFDSPVLLFDSLPNRGFSLVVKEVIDKVLALSGIVIVSPLLVITSIIIKVFSKGSILYKQERLGINGRKFEMYKFRTMIPDADSIKDDLSEKNEMDGPVFKLKEDPRVTPVGRLLRKTSIDELPQLINVLKGDMSLVGPRPPLSNEVVQYDPWQRRRLSMKPGITCLWQIGGRNNISFKKWMELDLKYIDNWSLWLDTKILAKTIPAVLSRKGAR